LSKINVIASDVARLAGVSQSTVSRVFTPGVNVSEKKKRRVLKAAEELGYSPNALARGLITNQTKMIGIVMVDIKNPFYPEVLVKFMKKLREIGYHVLFVNSESDDVQDDEVSQFLEYKVDGVIVMAASLSYPAVSRFIQYNIPVILFNRYAENSPCSVVSCDNFHGGNKVGEYLLQTGHRRLAFIEGKDNTSTSLERKKGFKETLLKQGHGEPLSEVGHFTYDGGYHAMMNLLSSPQPPDGVFCANDIMALGAMDAAKELNVKVPNNVSIIGFDNISLAEWAAYSLTTWEQPVDQMVSATIQLMLNEIKGESDQAVSQLIQGKIIERNSVMNRNSMLSRSGIGGQASGR
jgi:DNA-binding LacI/PurR family transcriptional regulator